MFRDAGFIGWFHGLVLSGGRITCSLCSRAHFPKIIHITRSADHWRAYLRQLS